MLRTTLPQLRCPRASCRGGDLRLEAKESRPYAGTDEITQGELVCPSCRRKYPILAGVTILVENPREYLLAHVKGIAREIPESAYPKEARAEMIQLYREIEQEHIEEDLESERVNALYLMAHYLSAKGGWWKTGNGSVSPEIQELITKHWDHGPFERIRAGLDELVSQKISLVELGCGAGGLALALSSKLRSYLGLDSSFSGITLARRLLLGLDYRKKKTDQVWVPGDLLSGALSNDVSRFVHRKESTGRPEVDFIVADAADANAIGLKPGKWDVCASLNMIDMLDQPEQLPEIQKLLLRPDGLAVQSSPYVWHPRVAQALRGQLPRQLRDSAEAVTELYRRAGFSIERSEEHVPWIFFKHARQVELYSVHVLFAKSARSRT